MIEFRNVSKVYNNGTEALHNINLQVDKGEFVFIVGSSGAGKSTFLKLIMCEERPNEGQIIVAGDDITRMRKGKIPFVRRKMGIVFQDFRLIEHMSVYDNVAFAMRVVGASGRSIKKRVPYILSLVGLQHKAKHRPSELSGGERQRVGLARALVNNPSMIIADEPTGNIDPALSFEIVDLLSEINRRGTTILMVTHEHSLVKHFHKRIIQIHSGEIVADTAAMQGAEITRAQAQEAYERERMYEDAEPDEDMDGDIAGAVDVIDDDTADYVPEDLEVDAYYDELREETADRGDGRYERESRVDDILEGIGSLNESSAKDEDLEFEGEFILEDAEEDRG